MIDLFIRIVHYKIIIIKRGDQRMTEYISPSHPTAHQEGYPFGMGTPSSPAESRFSSWGPHSWGPSTHRSPSWRCTESRHPGWGQSWGSREWSRGTWRPVERRAEGEVLALNGVPSPGHRIQVPAVPKMIDLCSVTYENKTSYSL